MHVLIGLGSGPVDDDKCLNAFHALEYVHLLAALQSLHLFLTEATTKNHGGT